MSNESGTDNNYSTEEKAIEKWIDGKTIYRIVIPINASGTIQKTLPFTVDTLKIQTGSYYAVSAILEYIKK